MEKESSKPSSLQEIEQHHHWYLTKVRIVLIIIITIIFISILSFLVYAYVQTQTPPQPVKETATISPTPADPMASWKTYKNNLFGYELKYPSSWYSAGPYGGQAGYECVQNPIGAIVEFSKEKLTDCGFVGEQLPPQSADITIWV